MNAAAKPGLGDLESTRPLSREERRAQAARVRAEQEAAEQQQPDATVVDEPVPTPVAPAATPSVKIPMKKRGDKKPFSTQLSTETTARLAWLVQQGGVLTDTVEAAIKAYLDAAGIPRPGPDGTMPTNS